MKLKGNVLVVKDDKLLLLANNRYYIAYGKAHVGDDVDFDPEDALQMPSYLFAIAAMEEENLDDTLDFIKTSWFKDKSKDNKDEK